MEVGHLDAVQTYETTIAAEGVPEFRFLTVPARVLPDPSGWDEIAAEVELDPSLVSSLLGLDAQVRPLAAVELPFALFACLREEEPEQLLIRPEELSEGDQHLFRFAEYLAFGELIPFESSDQRSRSLSSILVAGAGLGASFGAVAGGAKIGAGAGLVIGAPAGPLVILTTTGGFVVGGLVGAVTGALGTNIYDRLSGKQA